MRAVRAVTLERGWLGKTQFGRPVLVVRFDGAGGEDAAGWVVSEPAAWLDQIHRSGGGSP